jgi:hypothetical protein
MDDKPNYPRIWLQPFAGEEGSHTWCQDKQSDEDIEYVRADIARRIPPADNAVAVPAGEIPALLDRYWDLAYAEGKEGRDHDTPDGAAQETRTKLNLAFILAFIAGMEPTPSYAEGRAAGLREGVEIARDVRKRLEKGRTTKRRLPQAEEYGASIGDSIAERIEALIGAAP